MGLRLTVSRSGLLPETSSTRSIPRVGPRYARLMSPRMQERRSTASICFRSPRIASRRSIRTPAACSRPSRRLAAAVTSGLAWAEGTLWVGQHRDRKIYQIDPQTGAILRTIESNRFVTGVTWVDGELWHGTWEGDESELTRLDPATGEALERLDMPPGVGVSGLESDGGDQFFCGGGSSGKVRAVRRPRRGSTAGGRAETLVDSGRKSSTQSSPAASRRD